MVTVTSRSTAALDLSAPEAAISVQGDNAFVFVVSKSGDRTVAEQRTVVTGVRQMGFVEITDGVKPGERIVADGLNKIQPGQAIRPIGVQGGGPGGGPGGGQGRSGGAPRPTT